MFTEKTHNLLRKLQIIFAALASAMAVFSAAVDTGRVGIIITALLGAAGAFVGYMVEHDSAVYFDTRDIVDKVVPDTEEL